MRRLLLLLATVALLTAPLYLDTFSVVLLTRGVVWAIFGLSVWLLLRVLNLPSFGHAAFFGVAAYSAGLAVTRWGITNIFVALLVSVAIACAVALPIAAIAARLGNVAFLLVTLAFAEMLHSLAQRWRAVGGSDGLVGVVRPHAWPLPLKLFRPDDYFYFTVFLLAVVLLVLVTLTRSSLGGVLHGIRESEGRMQALGYQTYAYRVSAFIISAAIAGVAGAAHAYLNRFVSPEDLGALVSARGLLVVVVVGGAVWAPVLAAIVLTVGEDELSSRTQHWLGVIGIVYVLAALLDAEGIRRAWARVSARVSVLIPHRSRQRLEET